jgi:hypothetical protein
MVRELTMCFGFCPPLLTAGIMALCALLWAEIFLYSQNTLYLNDRWIVQKRMMEAGVTGGDQFLIARSPLAGNRLNLGAWYGFQDVVLREQLVPTKIQFQFNIPDESYLDVTYGRTEARFSGVRLSRREEMPSFNFESNGEGKFVSKTPVKIGPISRGWHKATVEVQKHRLILKIDELPEVQVSNVGSVHGGIGFRGGHRGAVVDNVAIETDRRGTISETFRNSRGQANAVILCFTFLLIIGAGFSMWSSKRLNPGYKRMLLHYAAISIVGIVFGALWYGFDFHYWSRRHFASLVQPLPSEMRFVPVSRFENLRFRVFASWNRLIGGYSITPEGVIARGYPPDRFWAGPIYCGPLYPLCKKLATSELNAIASERKAGYRILFVGTSQTVGAGAHRLGDTFFAQIYRKLSATLGLSGSLEALNMAISASTSQKLLEEYRRHYLDFSPDLVVINLSNNDPSTAFEIGISGFLKATQSTKIKAVFVEEANCAESSSKTNLLTNHQILRALARQHDVPIFSLHDFLGQWDILESGSIWHDFVHLTSYGQTLTADWLVPRLLRVLRGRDGVSSPFGVEASLHSGGIEEGRASTLLESQTMRSESSGSLSGISPANL